MRGRDWKRSGRQQSNPSLVTHDITCETVWQAIANGYRTNKSMSELQNGQNYKMERKNTSASITHCSWWLQKKKNQSMLISKSLNLSTAHQSSLANLMALNSQNKSIITKLLVALQRSRNDMLFMMLFMIVRWFSIGGAMLGTKLQRLKTLDSSISLKLIPWCSPTHIYTHRHTDTHTQACTHHRQQ